jgi:hypothetical protein
MDGNQNIPTKRKCNAILQFHGIGAYTTVKNAVYAPLRTHDLPRRWQHDTDMTVFEYVVLRRAYQVASPSQREDLATLAKQAETGDQVAAKRLRNYVLELIQKAEAPRSATAGK